MTKTITRSIETTCQHLQRARLASAHLHASGTLLCDWCENKFHDVYPDEQSVPLVLVNSRWVSLKALARSVSYTHLTLPTNREV